MKTTATPIECLCDERIIDDFHEMISLLIGRDIAAYQDFKNEVFRRAAEIRAKSVNKASTGCRSSKIIQFPNNYTRSA